MSGPIFVGGSGRSGTTPTSRLLGTHSALTVLPAELRIHVRPNGLMDTMRGLAAPADFVERCRGRWYRRPNTGGVKQWRTEAGLFEFIDIAELEPLLAGFAARVTTDPVGAGRALLKGVLDPVAKREGGTDWVEHSPENVTIAATLYKMFPELRFIHSIRDGRDVASSITGVAWGPADLEEAIRWWGSRMRQAHGQLNRLPPGSVLSLRFEDLVEGEREATFAKLLDFLGLTEEPGIREFFTERISTDRANIGRWRTHVPLDHQDGIGALYAGVVHSLRLDGVPLPAGAPDQPADADVQLLRQRRYEAAAAIEELRAEAQRLGGSEQGRSAPPTDRRDHDLSATVAALETERDRLTDYVAELWAVRSPG